MTNSWVTILVLVLLGLAVGRGMRWAVPYLLGMRDRSMPFALPWMEICAALGFVVVGLRLGIGLAILPWLFFTILLLTTSATDYLVKLIPDQLSLVGAGIGLLFNALSPGFLLSQSSHRLFLDYLGLDPASPWAGGVLSLAGALIGFMVLEGIRRVFSLAAKMQVMGMGDSKLLLMIGAFLGPTGALLALLTAFFVGVPHGLVYLKVLGQPHSPFAPPLALSAWLVLLYRKAIVGTIADFQSAVLRLPLEVLAAGYTLLIILAVALLWRTRRRAAAYERMIEDEYREVEERLED